MSKIAAGHHLRRFQVAISLQPVSWFIWCLILG